MASRDAARNRSPGRRTAPPAGQYDPAARSSLHGLRRTMPQTEARPTATNRHGGAPKGARPTLLDAGRFASARSAATKARSRASSTHMAGPPDAAASGRLSALRHPLGVVLNFKTPGAMRRGNDLGCLTSEDECGARRADDTLARPHVEEHRSVSAHVLATSSSALRCVSKYRKSAMADLRT